MNRTNTSSTILLRHSVPTVLDKGQSNSFNWWKYACVMIFMCHCYVLFINDVYKKPRDINHIFRPHLCQYKTHCNSCRCYLAAEFAAQLVTWAIRGLWYHVVSHAPDTVGYDTKSVHCDKIHSVMTAEAVCSCMDYRSSLHRIESTA